MTAWMNIADIKTDILYGIFVSHAYRSPIHKELGKSWSMWLYSSASNRRRGILYHKRYYQGCECLSFEVKVIDLIKNAKLEALLPREINVDDVALNFLEKLSK